MGAVDGIILRLQTADRWRQRDKAAAELRGIDWRCHPEVLDALVSSMLVDRHPEVREEAAESLAKIQPVPCTPEVHAALDRAARCERNLCARKWVKRALKRVGTQCRDECSLCGVPAGSPGLTEPAFVLPPGASAVDDAALTRTWEAEDRLEAQGDPFGQVEERRLVVPVPPRGDDAADPFADGLPPMETPDLPDPSQPLPSEPELLPPAPPADQARPFLPPAISSRSDEARRDAPDRLADARAADRERSGERGEPQPPPPPRRGGLFRGLLGRGR
jgi:hypothetical protein